MKIKNFKKKILVSSWILIAIGFAVAFWGFAQSDFSSDRFAEANGHRWYQTIYLENDSWTFGVEFDSFSITKIGGENNVLTMLYTE